MDFRDETEIYKRGALRKKNVIVSQAKGGLFNGGDLFLLPSIHSIKPVNRIY